MPVISQPGSDEWTCLSGAVLGWAVQPLAEADLVVSECEVLSNRKHIFFKEPGLALRSAGLCCGAPGCPHHNPPRPANWGPSLTSGCRDWGTWGSGECGGAAGGASATAVRQIVCCQLQGVWEGDGNCSHIS